MSEIQERRAAAMIRRGVPIRRACREARACRATIYNRRRGVRPLWQREQAIDLHAGICPRCGRAGLLPQLESLGCIACRSLDYRRRVV
jgi:hypothetical protein